MDKKSQKFRFCEKKSQQSQKSHENFRKYGLKIPENFFRYNYSP